MNVQTLPYAQDWAGVADGACDSGPTRWDGLDADRIAREFWAKEPDLVTAVVNGFQGYGWHGCPQAETMSKRPVRTCGGSLRDRLAGEQSPASKQYLISDLGWQVMLPILLPQFKLFHHECKPLAVV